ncbi:hypothetical protein D3C81_2279740 [compost metagenome]
MVVGTALGLFFIPLFFVVVQRVFNRTLRQGGNTAVAQPRNDGDTPQGGSHE